MSTLRPPDRAKFSPKKLASMSPVKVALFVEGVMLLSEDDKQLVKYLVGIFQTGGRSRGFWEINIERSRAKGVYYPGYVLRMIDVALDIVFRNEATA